MVPALVDLNSVHNRSFAKVNEKYILTDSNTKPEVRVRSLLHAMGYRFRLHRKDLPGRPDIVLPKLGTVIFVHGCFWHSHDCRWGTRTDSSLIA